MKKPKPYRLPQEFTYDPLGCQVGIPRLAYCEFFEDAERRTAAGEKQYSCLTCKRYRWKDQLCPKSEVVLHERDEVGEGVDNETLAVQA